MRITVLKYKTSNKMNRNGPLSDYYHRLYQASIGLTDAPEQQSRSSSPQQVVTSKKSTLKSTQSEPMDIPSRGRNQKRIDCQNCGKNIQAASLNRHMKSKRCIEASGSDPHSVVRDGEGGNTESTGRPRRGLLDLTMLSQPKIHSVDPSRTGRQRKIKSNQTTSNRQPIYDSYEENQYNWQNPVGQDDQGVYNWQKFAEQIPPGNQSPRDNQNEQEEDDIQLEY